MTDTITLPRSVAEQALEALKIGHESAHDCAETFHIEMAGYKQQRHEALDAEVKQISDAIGVLRAALEQPQTVADCHRPQPKGEPVGLLPLDCRGGYANLQPQAEQATDGGPNLLNPAVRDELAISWGYVKPQPKREPLTAERIFDLAEQFGEFRYGDAQGHKRIDFARAIERAHKIGGES